MSRLPVPRRRRLAGCVATLVAATALPTTPPTHAAPTPPHPGGDIVAVGQADGGRLDVPALPPGTWYVDVSAGFDHSAAVRSDGQVVAWGTDTNGKLTPPPLPAGVTYTAVAAENETTLALRSDGQIVPFAEIFAPSKNIPALPDGVDYVDVGLGIHAAAALRSDGQVVAWGQSSNPLLDVPPLPDGTTYVALDVGPLHALALRSDGQAVAWGSNGFGQTDVPSLPAGVTYTAISAGGGHHSVAVRSDGSAVGWGSNPDGRATPPPLPEGLSYVDVAASQMSSLFLRSDGSVVGSGSNSHGQRDLPAPGAGRRYAHVEGGSSFSLAIRSVVRPSTTDVRLPARSTYGKPTKVTVDVDGADLDATGSVTLRVDGTTYATTTLADGRATFDLGPTDLAPGDHLVVVDYPGAGWVGPSTSAPATLRVVKAVPRVRTRLVGRPVRQGTRPRLRVVVTAAGVTPTGRVEVRRGKKRVTTARLRANGVAVVRLPRTRPGLHRYRVVYVGSAEVRQGGRPVTVRVRPR